VSREPIARLRAADFVEDWSPDDLRLQIDLRFRLDDLTHAQLVKPESLRAPNPAELCRIASGIYDARRKRDKILSDDLFGEPAWDMILALYCLPARGEKLSVTGLSYAANAPPSTGHRVQAALSKQGLIERKREKSDARRQIVQLTLKGRALLENYLSSLFHSNGCINGYLEAIGA